MKVINPLLPKQNDCFQCCLNGPKKHTEEPEIPFDKMHSWVKKQKISLKRRKANRNGNPPDLRQELLTRTYNESIKWDERTRDATHRPENTKALQIEKKVNYVTYYQSGRQPAADNFIDKNGMPHGLPLMSMTPKFTKVAESTERLKCSNFQNPNFNQGSRTERVPMRNIESMPNFKKNILFSPKMKKKIPTPLRLLDSTSSPMPRKNKRSDLSEGNRPQILTVDSVLGTQPEEERVSQSTIEIDFFNPSLKRLQDISNF